MSQLLPTPQRVDVTPKTAEPSDVIGRRCRIDPEAQRRGALKGSRIAAERRREAAVSADERVRAYICLCRAEGQSLAEIACELTQGGWLSRQGRCKWHAAQVQRVIDRALPIALEEASNLETVADALRRTRRMELRRRRARQPASRA